MLLKNDGSVRNEGIILKMSFSNEADPIKILAGLIPDFAKKVVHGSFMSSINLTTNSYIPRNLTGKFCGYLYCQYKGLPVNVLYETILQWSEKENAAIN